MYNHIYINTCIYIYTYKFVHIYPEIGYRYIWFVDRLFASGYLGYLSI